MDTEGLEERLAEGPEARAMKVDAPFPQAPLAAPAPRPATQAVEQASARPVDRPHHAEASENNLQHRQHTPLIDTRGEGAPPRSEADTRQQAARSHDDSAPPAPPVTRNPGEPVQVGELLDVLA